MAYGDYVGLLLNLDRVDGARAAAVAEGVAGAQAAELPESWYDARSVTDEEARWKWERETLDRKANEWLRKLGY